MRWLLRLFQGRTSRRAYLLYWLLPSSALAIGLTLLPEQAAWFEIALIGIFAALIPIDLIFGIRRFHDTGLSGWWYVLLGFPLHERAPALIIAIIAAQSFPLILDDAGAQSGGWAAPAMLVGLGLLFVAMWWTLYRLCLKAGEAGPNRFGEDPIQARAPPPSAQAQ